MSHGRHLDASFDNHSFAVCTLAMIIGQALGYDTMKLHELATAALLHDFGLLQLPRHLLRTTTSLSGEDLAAFHHHPQLDAMAIETQRDFSQTVRQVVAEHHVTPDGNGYPSDTSAGSTTEASRIVRIADRYDELLTGFGGAPTAAFPRGNSTTVPRGRIRPSRSSSRVPVHQAGWHLPHLQFRELNTKERGMITTINQATLHQPIVTLTYDETGSPYRNPFTVDLSNQDQPPSRFVERVVTSESGEASTSSDSLAQRGCSRSASSTDYTYAFVGLTCKKPRRASVSNASRWHS